MRLSTSRTHLDTDSLIKKTHNTFFRPVYQVLKKNMNKKLSEKL